MTFLGIALIGIMLIIIVAVYQARKISQPLRKLEEIAKEIADGNYRHEFAVKGPFEIEHLAASINQMADKLEAEKHQLEEWADTLERKVEERTDEIKRIHAQLFRSEKLASLGKRETSSMSTCRSASLRWSVSPVLTSLTA